MATKEEIKENVKKYVDIGVEKSKIAFKKAGGAIQKFGDESVTRLEKRQFEAKRERELRDLGLLVWEMIKSESETANLKENDKISPLLEKLRNYEEEIARREEALSNDK